MGDTVETKNGMTCGEVAITAGRITLESLAVAAVFLVSPFVGGVAAVGFIGFEASKDRIFKRTKRTTVTSGKK